MKTREEIYVAIDTFNVRFGRHIGNRMVYSLCEAMINAEDGKKCLMVVRHKSQESAIKKFLKDFPFRNSIDVVTMRRE